MKRLAFMLIAVTCLVLAARGEDWATIRDALTSVRIAYIVGALPVLVAVYVLRGHRWFYLFPTKTRARDLSGTFGTLMIGYFANNILPARGGEVARVIAMARRNQLSEAGVLSTIIMERTLDGVFLGILALLALQATDAASLRWLRYVAALFIPLFAILLTLGLQGKRVEALLNSLESRFRWQFCGAIRRQVVCALDHLETTSTLAGMSRVLSMTVIIWLLDASVYALISLGFSVRLDVSTVALLVAATNFASLAPIPGGLGAFELAGAEVLVRAGFDRGTGLTIVAIQHSLQYLLCTVLGLYYISRLGVSLRQTRVVKFRRLLGVEDAILAEARTYPRLVKRLEERESASEPYISMVIPAYNEEKRIVPTLLTVLDYFQRVGYAHELLVVDDGSNDQTAELVRSLSRHFPQVQLIRLPRNMGKGAAVRTGVRNAVGQFVIFNDADGSTPVTEVERLLAALKNADVAIGSRALYSPETRVERKVGRAFVGRVFAFLVNVLAVPGIADTQCGFKMFRRDVARRIFEIQLLDGFAFDVEVLRIATVLGYRIAEVPVNWTHASGSKVRLLRDSILMLRDIVRIRYRVPSGLRVVDEPVPVGATYDGGGQAATMRQ